ncbi:MAG: hypothetical protein MJ231_03125, partial [bacterium]|nr:hypothetical protein [bacterium]
MEYEFLDKSIDKEHILLPNSEKINPYLLKNNEVEIIKALDFIASEDKFLHVHGFIGTGKRQFIDYVTEFLSKEVIKLEYYCKASTVCDDILLVFNEYIESLSISKAINLNAKITTLAVKFQQQISSIKKPFLIILHSIDDILPENIKLVSDILNTVLKEDNVKVIISTRAMQPEFMNDFDDCRKIFLKAFTKEIFKEFISEHFNAIPDKSIEDFYKETRGYYYYVALSVKIIQAMQISIAEFLRKYNESGMTFDAFLGVTYVNLIPTTIRNFFWFLRVVRHGLSLNALAVFEIYDEFSIEYLKSNLMIFQVGETIYVQDYFLQKIDIMIPEKTEIKLHKYIIGIYEKQLKENLKDRVINISRQAMRAEIDYHNQCIENIKNAVKEETTSKSNEEETASGQTEPEVEQQSTTIVDKINKASKFVEEKKITEAIELYKDILDTENIDLTTVVETRLNLGKLYKEIEDYRMASHYYEMVETYYMQHKENINLNYLYYDMTDLYFKMYKNERAIQTVKNVIYSVQSVNRRGFQVS